MISKGVGAGSILAGLSVAALNTLPTVVGMARVHADPNLPVKPRSTPTSSTTAAGAWPASATGGCHTRVTARKQLG
jgi:hypothetical protein